MNTLPSKFLCSGIGTSDLTEALAVGETVELRNFGVFKVKTRRARIGRNPKVPEIDVKIPATAQVKFTAGKLMRKAVLKLSPKA
jgi:nucleoid DNA-binding protein